LGGEIILGYRPQGFQKTPEVSFMVNIVSCITDGGYIAHLYPGFHREACLRNINDQILSDKKSSEGYI